MSPGRREMLCPQGCWHWGQGTQEFLDMKCLFDILAATWGWLHSPEFHERPGTPRSAGLPP